MDYKTNIRTQSLILNGVHYPAPYQKNPQEYILRMVKEQPELGELAEFLTEWFDSSPTLTVQTSGSTGSPKSLLVEKRRMMASAVATCQFLQLKEMDSALLCMSTRYIAGKMMVVRALVASLNLITVPPSSHPLAEVREAPTFAAMIPMQLHHSLQQPEERKLLTQIKQLIIGGGAIHPEIEEEIRNFPHQVWSTYGMTETLSHIALRQINGTHRSKNYKPLPGIELTTNKEGQLIIDAPALCKEQLITNDIVSFNEVGEFLVRGRKDNTLNSGGVKIQVEEVETLLQTKLKNPFAITSIADKQWGDKMVLLTTQTTIEEVKAICQQLLPPYWQPKEIFVTKEIPLTETGKVNREEAKEVALQEFKKRLQ
ncbi:MAG: AMP-binding protein [Phocaeicola sp.]